MRWLRPDRVMQLTDIRGYPRRIGFQGQLPAPDGIDGFTVHFGKVKADWTGGGTITLEKSSPGGGTGGADIDVTPSWDGAAVDLNLWDIKGDGVTVSTGCKLAAETLVTYFVYGTGAYLSGKPHVQVLRKRGNATDNTYEAKIVWSWGGFTSTESGWLEWSDGGVC